MEERKQVAVIGSDARQAAAGRALARAGYTVCGAEQIALADYILLPLPLDETRTPLAELLRAAKPGALALGGRLSAQAKQIAQEAGVELVDYFAREELTIWNAIPTAEGCLAILLRQRKRTLWGSGVLVTGFGPVGQALGPRLAALGPDVTIAARRPAQRALAESLGLRSVPLAALAGVAPAFDRVGEYHPGGGAHRAGAGGAAAGKPHRGLGIPPRRHRFCGRPAAGADGAPCAESASGLRTGDGGRICGADGL